jgi:transcriptional regulator with XRE-family HTH domain
MPIASDLLQQQLVSFGERLKRLRLRHDWTLDDLADRSGLSKAYLSRLESGDRQASIAAALTLAEVFRVSLASMFEHEAAEPCAIVRAAETEAHSSNGLTYWPLSSAAPQFHLQPLRVIVPVNREEAPHQQHNGEEWLYVLSGKLTLFLDGNAHELAAGDAAHFDARLPHRLAARGRLDAEVLLVAVPGAKANFAPGRSLRSPPLLS